MLGLTGFAPVNPTGGRSDHFHGSYLGQSKQNIINQSFDRINSHGIPNANSQQIRCLHNATQISSHVFDNIRCSVLLFDVGNCGRFGTSGSRSENGIADIRMPRCPRPVMTQLEPLRAPDQSGSSCRTPPFALHRADRKQCASSSRLPRGSSIIWATATPRAQYGYGRRARIVSDWKPSKRSAPAKPPLPLADAFRFWRGCV